MKLTEQQLAVLFSSIPEHSNTESNQAADCLAASPASSERLRQAEQLLDDPVSAQAMKAAIASKPWAEAVSRDLEQRQQPWFQRLFNPGAFRWAAAGAAFALVLMVVAPVGVHDSTPGHTPVAEQNVANDLISNGRFELNQDDVLNMGGFEKVNDRSKDQLSRHSFG